MRTYSFQSPEIKFELIFDEFFESDYKKKNPFNTVLHINVQSYGYAGKSDWTVDYNAFKSFIYKLRTLFEDLKGSLTFKDLEYGSILNVKCEKKGDICFSGMFTNCTFQTLEFNFYVTQSEIQSFVMSLFNDFSEDLLVKKIS